MSPGLLLAACTSAALILANSPLAAGYASLLQMYFLGLSFQHWINDGLMTVFFFVVGMEIKRELVVGELKSPKRAALPIAAALGGMIAPALFYWLLNPSGAAARGWGIPMATDIVFAVAVLNLFRVSPALKVFLLALAIVDDLGAVLVIALFYSQGLSGPFLAGAAIFIGLMPLLRRAGLRSYWPYVPLGILAWYCVLRSGVHATMAGVLIGLLTPLALPGEERSPLQELTRRLHPWIDYLVMPVFALANAGVSFSGTDFRALLAEPVFQGVFSGLFLGKPLGILAASFLVVRLGWAERPSGTGWRGVAGAACLGGIGFTMALFISSLALPQELELPSKAGILFASLGSALAGAAVLFRRPRA